MDIDTVSVTRFKRKEISKLNSVFVDEFSGYDDFFWEDYNFIKPDKLWQKAIKRLRTPK